MKQVLAARLVLMAIGILIWGYGQRAELPEVRIAGMVVLATALLLRFVPKRWFGGE